MNAQEEAANPQSLSFLPGFDRLARGLLLKRLETIHDGQIVVRADGKQFHLGEASELSATIEVHDSRFFGDVILGGALSVAESYLRGDWDCDQLTSLFRIFVRNMDATTRLGGGVARLTNVAHQLYHWWHSNSPQGSRKNIGAHYDLGNDFFRLWLDETMTYSSGVFPTSAASLAEASIEKIDRLCRKLELCADDHLLEIGTGWGALAIHAAENYGCQVTTTTISTEQYEFARRRIDEAGLNHRITLLAEDYRSLRGQYDKLVSVEMIEAVGHRHLKDYFRQCSSLLRPDGTLVIQAIVLPERGYSTYLQNVDFIQRYIFPGGCLPSLGSMLEAAGQATDLRFVHAEDFAPHYAKTLNCWRKSFLLRLDEVRELGYSEQFVRMWDYYLCYCEAVFEERYGGVIQVQFDKPRYRRDPIRISTNASLMPRSKPESSVIPRKVANGTQRAHS